MRGVKGRSFRQTVGVEQREVDGEMFLVSPKTGSIHHLDPMGVAIWRQYAEPKTLIELEKLLTSAFPDADPKVVAKDLERMFCELRNCELICETE